MPLECPLAIAERFPRLCLPVDIYCERTSPALDAELINAFSNAAFLAAALAAWMLLSRRPMPRSAGLVRWLIVVTAAIGLGSFLFHTVATRWAVWADIVPILVFILLYLWLLLTRFFGWRWWMALPALIIFLAATLLTETVVPPTTLRGGAMYAPALLAMVVIGLALLYRTRRAGQAMLLAVLVFAVSLTARTLDLPLCDALPWGTHFIWHLLNGLLLYQLIRIAILHQPGPVRPPGPAAR